MQNHSHGLLDDATPDELLSCIRLLAISVVQHRAKCGFVTSRKSTEDLRGTADTAEAAGLFVQSKEVLEKALEMVRTLAADLASAPATPDQPDRSSAENRTQFRIKISIPIKILWPHDAKPFSATLKDISWGGASQSANEGGQRSHARLRSTEVYRVDLKFEHPSEELKKRTSELFSNMASTKCK